MTTNIHDKMLAAIDAYFSASDGTEEEVAENLLLDVRDEINKQKYVPETNFGNMTEPKIGCVNHDCDQCKAVQEPVGEVSGHDWSTGLLYRDLEPGTPLYTAPPAPQPVPVKTYHDGKPWPVAPKPWVGLTDEEFEDIELGCRSTPFGKIEAMQKVEAKLKEKNA
jgi:hypothetical protein